MTLTITVEGFEPANMTIPDESLIAYTATAANVAPEAVTPQMVYDATLADLQRRALELVQTFPPASVTQAVAAAQAIADAKRAEWLDASNAVITTRAAAIAEALT